MLLRWIDPCTSHCVGPQVQDQRGVFVKDFGTFQCLATSNIVVVTVVVVIVVMSSSSSSRSRRSIGCIAIQCDQSMVFVHRRLYRFAKGHQDVVLRHRNDRRTPFVGNVVTEIVVAGFVLVEIGHAAALSQGHVVGGIKEDPHVYFGSSGIGGTRAIITNNARKIEVPYVVSTGGPSNVHDVLAKVVGKKIVAFFTASKQASQNVIVIVVVVIIAVVIAVLGCCFCCRFWRDGFFPMIRRR
mmetsp:Transcript_3854/g.8692  ORF Transcript_3854/g.8692 Transcript_3854/m.8692 type:complete len:241 (-) Transcript_3854:537-1259(-)